MLSAGVSPSGACRCTETAALTLRESESAAGIVQARSSSKSLPCRVKFKVLRLLSGPFPPLHSSSLAYQLEKENKSFLVPGPSARPTRSLSRTHFIREQGLSHQQSHVRPPSHEGGPALLGGSGTRRDPSSEFPQQGDPHAHHGFVPGPCSAPPESRPNSHAAIITVIDSKTGIPETFVFFFFIRKSEMDVPDLDENGPPCQLASFSGSLECGYAPQRQPVRGSDGGTASPEPAARALQPRQAARPGLCGKPWLGHQARLGCLAFFQTRPKTNARDGGAGGAAKNLCGRKPGDLERRRGKNPAGTGQPQKA